MPRRPRLAPRPRGSVPSGSARPRPGDAAQLVAVVERALMPGEAWRRGHRRWCDLWAGTLECLRREEPLAYARVLAKLERHGLAGRTLLFTRGPSGLTVEEPVELAGGVTDPTPPEGVAAAAGAYARDSRPVKLRGRTGPLPRRAELVLAYYGARWKLEQAGRSQKPLKGDHSLEARAFRMVAERYGLKEGTAADTIKRARAAMPPAWASCLFVGNTSPHRKRTVSPELGPMLWTLTMQGALKT